MVGVVDSALARVGVGEPEGAGEEGAVFSGEAVVAEVAVDERPAPQLPPDRRREARRLQRSPAGYSRRVNGTITTFGISARTVARVSIAKAGFARA